MRKEVRYISELGRSFLNAEDAIEDDKRLPHTIKIYKNDLERMEAGLETFGGKPVTEELKENWRNAILQYEEKWVRAQASWENKN